MVKVLDRKLTREILDSKVLLGAVALVVAVGVACLVSMLGTFWNLEVARDEYYARCRMADFWIDLKKAPISEVENLYRVPGVAELRHRISFPVIVDLEGVDRPISGQVQTLPDVPAPVINNIVLRRGSYFTGQRRDEVIVSEKFAAARGLHPGTFVHVIMKRERKKLFVVGTAITSEYTYLTPPGAIAPDPTGYGLFFIKREFAEDVFDFKGACNNVVGLLTPEARQRPQEVLDALEKRLDAYGVFQVTPRKDQTSHLTLSAEMTGLRLLATLLPAIFFGVATLVLNILMTRMTDRQRTIIGTFKALGWRDGTILFHFVKFGIAVGLAGSVVGCGIGYWTENGMTRLYGTLFEFPSLETRVYPGVMAVAAAVAVFFSTLGTLRGVLTVLALSPAEAMRPRPPPVGHSVLIEKWRTLWAHLDFRWQMVLRSLIRHKMRTGIGLLSSALGSGLVLVALGTANSLDHMMNFQFDKVLLSDYDLSFKDELDLGAVDEASRLPGVYRAEPLLEVPCSFFHDQRRKRGVITGVQKGAELTVPQTSDGQAVPVPPRGLLMTRRLAEALGVRRGDSVTFRPVKGLRRFHEVPVTSLVDSTVGLSVYADYGYLNRLIGEFAAVSRVQLKAQHTESARRSFLRSLKRYPTLQSVSVIPYERERMEREFIDKLSNTTNVLILFACVIFLGSILNSSLVAVAERRREIATFRALGYGPVEIGTIFLRENLAVNVTGAVLGLGVGYAMLYGLAAEFQNDVYAMPCIVYGTTWWWTLVTAFLFALGAHVVVQREIQRLDWAEALRFKE